MPSSVKQPRFGELLLDLGELVLAADERGELLRKVVGRRFERPQRRELLPQLRVDHLVYVLWMGQVAQPHGTQVAQRHAVGQTITNEIDDRLRQQDLPAMRRAHDPRSAIDGVPVIVVVAANVDAGVEPAAHAQRNAASGTGLLQRQLQLQRRRAAHRAGPRTTRGRHRRSS